MTPGVEIEPGPHWWKASALTTSPTLPPYIIQRHGNSNCQKITIQACLTQKKKKKKPTSFSRSLFFSSPDVRERDTLRTGDTVTDYTVLCLDTWPLNESEADVDLVLIETSLLLLC